MIPKSHAADTGCGNVDRLEPDGDFIGIEAAEPFAGWPTVTISVFGGRQLWVEIGACVRYQIGRFTQPHFGGHEAVVDVTDVLGLGLARRFINRRGGSRVPPRSIDMILAFEPAPGFVACDGPMLGADVVLSDYGFNRLDLLFLRLSASHGRGSQAVESCEVKFFGDAKQAEADPECELSAVHSCHQRKQGSM